MTSRRTTTIVALGVALLLAACGGAPDAPSVDAAAGTTTSASETAPSVAAPSLDALTDTWTVVPGDDATLDAGTFVGYRVEEELARIGAQTAVGRTPAVAGSLVIADGAVTSLEVVADLTGLTSDSGNRDNALRRRGLETADFPEATFVLTTPIELPDAAVDGSPVTLTATGELTLHGVTNPVEVELSAQVVSATRLVAAGQIEVVMSDYGVTPPRIGPVVSIADEGIAELQLQFER